MIADLTDAKSVAHELSTIIPDNPSVPVQPLILATQAESAMFEQFRRYPWVLEPYRYNTLDQLVSDFDKRVIAPLETKWISENGKVNPPT